MSGQADPWDAMAQNDDSDEDYIPTGADGIDDEDEDFEQDGDYHDVDEDDDDISDDAEPGDLGDIVLSPCTVRFSCATLAECGIGFAQTSSSETMESLMLPPWSKFAGGSKRNWRIRKRKNILTTTTSIHPTRASSEQGIIGIQRSLSLNLLV